MARASILGLIRFSFVKTRNMIVATTTTIIAIMTIAIMILGTKEESGFFDDGL